MSSERARNPNVSGILVFAAGGKKYCLHMDDVSRILNYEEYQQLFSHSLLLHGYFQFNDKNVHLVQMDSHDQQKVITENSRLIIFGVEDYYLGLWVDRVEEINLSETKGLEYFRTRFIERGEGNPPVRLKDGVINFKGRALIVHRYNSLRFYGSSEGRELNI